MEKEEKPLSDFEKIMQLNKLGALFLSGDKYEKAQNILKKTLQFYIEKKEKKEIPNFFYSILYCNLAKVYSCQKNFKDAEPLYRECIQNHPLYKLLCKHSEMLSNSFCITNIKNLLSNKDIVTEEKILNKFSSLMKYFDNDSESRKEFTTKILKEYKSNNLNTISSLSDSLVNLSVILQIDTKDLESSLDMYILALLIDEDNTVANVNYNNFLREVNLKPKSDEYIIKRIQFALNDTSITITPADAAIKSTCQSSQNSSKVNFICMKWGTKYGSDYVNKLYHGIRNNTKNEFCFFCITDNADGLDSEIRPIKLETPFSGWMKKSMLFDEKILKQITENSDETLCFIDLDMIVYNNIDFIFEYKGNFCLMKTDDIQCENSVNGYNSSVVVWKRGFGKEIYSTMEKYEKALTKQIVRFDHYLEFIVKNSDFTQDVFKGKILDYNTYCKGKKDLPENGAIVAFPRSPKPHECNEEWIKKFWN